MSYTLRLDLSNPGSQPVHAVIYGGTVFEVTDPFSRVQNLAVIADTPVTVPARGRGIVHVQTYCLNQPFSPPDQTRMRLTSLALSKNYQDQSELWEDLAAHT